MTKVTNLIREIGSRTTAWDFSDLTGLLPDPDPILVKRGDGVAILDGLMADGHLTSVIQTRKVGTLSRHYKWLPGTVKGRSTPASEELSSQLTADLKGVRMHELMSGILDAPYFGFMPIEISWQVTGNHVRIKQLRILPHRWFGFDEKNRPKFKSNENPWDGTKLPLYKFVFARHFPTYDNPYGLRLLSRCFWPVVFKKGGIKFWVTFTEKYGIPFLLGRYRQGATEKEKKDMLSSLAKMAQDATAIVPDGNKVEMLGGTGKTGGSYLAFGKLIDAMNAEISKVIMGQTLAAEVGDTGSYAASNTHENILRDYQSSDQMMIKEVMTEIAYNYGQVNAPGVPHPVFSWFENENPQLSFAKRDKTLTSGGVRLTKKYYMRRYGYNDDDIKLVTKSNSKYHQKEHGFFTSPRKDEGNKDFPFTNY